MKAQEDQTTMWTHLSDSESFFRRLRKVHVVSDDGYERVLIGKELPYSIVTYNGNSQHFDWYKWSLVYEKGSAYRILNVWRV